MANGSTVYPIHMTRDAFRTVCGRTADLRCVGEEDWEAVTCCGCMDWFKDPPAVDMGAAMRRELPDN